MSQAVYDSRFHITVRTRDELEGAVKVEQVKIFHSHPRQPASVAGL